MTAADRVYKALKEKLGIEGATGEIRFKLSDFDITVEQNDIVGNILEEWLGKWMTKEGIPNRHNKKQESPDFWLNLEDENADWLEVKSFTKNPNFDVAAFRSFISLIIDKPWKLHSKYLLISYTMQDGIVTIKQIWLKNIWEICCSSGSWPIKVQCKRGQINNIRPATWYSKKSDFEPFNSLEDFLAAVEETIYKYADTRYTLAEKWISQLKASYKKFYNVDLDIPRWNDIKSKYIKSSDKQASSN
ncbi:MAG: NgoBV family restriction endonuclease [Akkermansia sp.]|nr:NgoBV family restriction endonuclease [Akkermansia sp.]